MAVEAGCYTLQMSCDVPDLLPKAACTSPRSEIFTGETKGEAVHAARKAGWMLLDVVVCPRCKGNRAAATRAYAERHGA